MAIAVGIEKVGDALNELGCWLRHALHLDEEAPSHQQQRRAGGRPASAGRAAAEEPRGEGNPLDTVLGGAMVVAVALLSIIVLRRPAVLLRVFRKPAFL